MKIVIMPIREGGDYLANMSDGRVSCSLSAPTLHELLTKLAEQTAPIEDAPK